VAVARQYLEEDGLMLANAPEPLGNLEPLRLLFLLLQGNSAGIPETLKEQALLIIEQAQRVARDPHAIDEHTLPEAIALAFAMRTSQALAQDIGQIQGLESIDRARATRTLEHLNAAFIG
jgi:hypothetical protein